MLLSFYEEDLDKIQLKREPLIKGSLFVMNKYVLLSF